MKMDSMDHADDDKSYGNKPNLKGDGGGVFDRNPDPGLSEYGRSTGGPNEIPTKFAEDIKMPTKKNPMASSVMERNNQQAQESTVSRINKKPNRYDSANNK